MAAKTPLALVQEKFGDKAKLVEAVEKLTGEDLWVSRTNKEKGLAHVSNAKLLRLHSVFTEVKARFGTREKLIEAILELEKRGKDAGLRQKLGTWPVPRLFDAYRSAVKRSAPSSPTGAGPTARGVKAAAPVQSPKGASTKPRSTAKAKTPSR
ncbi:MAG TPA: hypothetical protein VEK07_24250 [Polyangiaceae bacterium]|nr:hypothetical protein [Polyangiaceae bacterium]